MNTKHKKSTNFYMISYLAILIQIIKQSEVNRIVSQLLLSRLMWSETPLTCLTVLRAHACDE